MTPRSERHLREVVEGQQRDADSTSPTGDAGDAGAGDDGGWWGWAGFGTRLQQPAARSQSRRAVESRATCSPASARAATHIKQSRRRIRARRSEYTRRASRRPRQSGRSRLPPTRALARHASCRLNHRTPTSRVQYKRALACVRVSLTFQYALHRPPSYTHRAFPRAPADRRDSRLLAHNGRSRSSTHGTRQP